MSFHSNLPDGCTTNDLPGWERPYVEPEIREEVEYFPVVRTEIPDRIKAILERVRAR
jgi:hypothetical protein